MKKSRIREEQKIEILQQAAVGAQIPVLRRKHGVTETTFFRWRGLRVIPPSRSAWGERTESLEAPAAHSPGLAALVAASPLTLPATPRSGRRGPRAERG